MTESTSRPEIGSRRQSVQFDRVMCWRLGPGELERCRECVYLLRLAGPTGGSAAAYVICADESRELDVPFTW